MFFGTIAAGGELGFLLADFEVGANAVVLLFADQRAHLGVALERRAELDGLGFGRHGFDKLAVDGALDQDAAAGRADFALVDEDAEERAVDGGFEVGVGEEDVGRLAAELERDALHGVGGHLDDLLAHGGAAGEGDLVDVGMLYQRRTGGFAEAGDDVDDAVGQAAVLEVLRQFESGEGRLLGGLQDAGAAGGQRGRQLPCGHQQRIVPGNDLSGDADGLLQRQAQRVVGNGIDVPGDLGRQAAVVLEAGGDVGHVVLGFDDGLAAVAGFEFGEGSGVLANGVGQLEEHATALLRGAATPMDRSRRRLWRRRRRGRHPWRWSRELRR